MEPGGSSPHSQVPATSSQLNSVHTPTSNFLKIHLNITLPSTPGSPQWSLSLRFLHQNPVHASSLPHTRYMLRQSHSARFYHPSNSGWGVQITKHHYQIKFVEKHFLNTHQLTNILQFQISYFIFHCRRTHTSVKCCTSLICCNCNRLWKY
jgi:hypothetical protein